MSTHIAEDARSIVEYGIDAYCLLEYGKHDADEDAHNAIGEEALGLHGDGFLDVLQDLLGLLAAVYLRQNAESLVVLANHHQIAWSLWNEADEQSEEACGYCLGTEHIAPTRGHRPLGSGIDGSDALTHFLHQRLNVVAKDEEVDEVNQQLTEDNGKLVPRNKHTANIRRCNLANIHRADGRSQTYTDTTDDTIDVEHDEQREARSAVLEEQKLRFHASQCRDEEQHTCQNE